MTSIFPAKRPFRSMLRHRRGNVMLLFALTLPVLTFGTGMGIDYAQAMKAQTRLNAIADAAALSAVNKTMMGRSDSEAAAYARQVFMDQYRAMLDTGSVTVNQLNVQTVTDNSGRRTASISYSGALRNSFGQILGRDWMAIAGKSATTNAVAPDIDFYMLLDVSGSMALPTTTVGLKKVADSNSRGCRFACHSVNDLKGRNAQGKMTDLYGVAQSYGLSLRIDDEGRAVSKLTETAKTTASRNGANYRIAIHTFRGRGGFTTLQSLTKDMTTAASKTKYLIPSLFYSNGCPTQQCGDNDVGKGDLDSAHSDAFDRVNEKISNPGTGQRGTTPQAVVFVVTDGMRDEYRSGGRPEINIDPAKCEQLKSRKIRIAILYTEYLKEALENDAWSQQNVAPYLYKVEPALQACASPGLYTKVSTDQDISNALDALFRTAVATARITQ